MFNYKNDTKTDTYYAFDYTIQNIILSVFQIKKQVVNFQLKIVETLN